MTDRRHYVVDASVAAKWYLDEPGEDVAREVLRHAASGSLSLSAPDLLLVEVANVAWQRYRREQLTAEEAAEIARMISQAPVAWVSGVRMVYEATLLATEYGCTVYDATYLALAVALDTRVITADRRLQELVPQPGRTERVVLLQDFPA